MSFLLLLSAYCFTPNPHWFGGSGHPREPAPAALQGVQAAAPRRQHQGERLRRLARPERGLAAPPQRRGEEVGELLRVDGNGG